jgi:hypothetical protein
MRGTGALSQAEIGMGAIATLAWQCYVSPTCSRKREHGTSELRRDKTLGRFIFGIGLLLAVLIEAAFGA